MKMDACKPKWSKRNDSNISFYGDSCLIDTGHDREHWRVHISFVEGEWKAQDQML